MRKSTKVLIGMYAGAVVTGLVLSMLAKDKDDNNKIPGVDTNISQSRIDVLKEAIKSELDKGAKK